MHELIILNVRVWSLERGLHTLKYMCVCAYCMRNDTQQPLVFLNDYMQ